MREVFYKLFVGNERDFRTWPRDRPALVAAKEPFHRVALGYKTLGAPKNHPEYLVALRGNRMILNLVDAPTHEFIDVSMIDQALSFINNDTPFLIACNQGISRSPTIALMWLAKNGHMKGSSFEELEMQFRKVYPLYNPSKGMRAFAKLYLFHPEAP